MVSPVLWEHEAQVRFLLPRPNIIMGDWRNWERNCFASNSQEFESLILHHIRMKIENVISNKIVYR